MFNLIESFLQVERPSGTACPSMGNASQKWQTHRASRAEIKARRRYEQQAPVSCCFLIRYCSAVAAQVAASAPLSLNLLEPPGTIVEARSAETVGGLLRRLATRYGVSSMRHCVLPPKKCIGRSPRIRANYCRSSLATQFWTRTRRSKRLAYARSSFTTVSSTGCCLNNVA